MSVHQKLQRAIELAEQAIAEIQKIERLRPIESHALYNIREGVGRLQQSLNEDNEVTLQDIEQIGKSH